MVDRQQLRETAKSAGSSIAGTFKSGAQKAKEAGKNVAKNTKKGAGQIKEDITGSADQGEIDLLFDQERGKYILIGPSNETLGTFDDEMQAKAAAREAKRELDTSESTGGFQAKAQRFAQGVNSSLSSAGEALESDGTEADETPESESSGPTLPMMEQTAQDGDNGPEMPFMSGGGDAENEQGPTLPGFGASEGDGDAPMLSGFGGSGSDGEPQLPMFGGGDGDGPSMPMFDGPEDGEATISGFGISESEEDSDSQPWMF